MSDVAPGEALCPVRRCDVEGAPLCEPGEAGGAVRREPRSMIDVTPRELPSSIAGQRKRALALLASVILGGRFAIFAVLRGSVALKRCVATYDVT
jgi:hypothetical protein